MVTLRRAQERHQDRRRKQLVWHTFDPEDRADALADGFGILEILNEDRLPPGAGVPRHPHRDAEIITYVHEGSLTHEDSMGRSGVILAGEFQQMTAGRGIRHSEANTSRTQFCAAERRGTFCVVASPDGRRGSLRIHQDALLYSAMLDTGQHVLYELAPGRCAWLHLVEGEVMLGDVVLTAGDGVGVAGERVVSLTALEQTELLLLDLGH